MKVSARAAPGLPPAPTRTDAPGAPSVRLPQRSASLGEIYSHSLMTDYRWSTPVLPVGPTRKYQRGCGDEYQISDLKSLQEQLISAKTKILTAEGAPLPAAPCLSLAHVCANVPQMMASSP